MHKSSLDTEILQSSNNIKMKCPEPSFPEPPVLCCKHCCSSHVFKVHAKQGVIVKVPCSLCTQRRKDLARLASRCTFFTWIILGIFNQSQKYLWGKEEVWGTHQIKKQHTYRLFLFFPDFFKKVVVIINIMMHAFNLGSEEKNSNI